MAAHRKQTSDSGTADLNISPLIDMVFILLIFFIVTTVFVEETGLKITKPTIDGKKTDAETVTFRITGQGQVFFEGTDIGLSSVRATVRNAMQKELLPVIIQVENEAPSGVAVRVMDEVKVAKPDAQISLTQTDS